MNERDFEIESSGAVRYGQHKFYVSRLDDSGVREWFRGVDVPDALRAVVAEWDSSNINPELLARNFVERINSIAWDDWDDEARAEATADLLALAPRLDGWRRSGPLE